MKEALLVLIAIATFFTVFTGCGKVSESYTPANVLSNPDSTIEAQKLYDYIFSGKNCLSAQQESTWMGSADYEIDYIFDVTGKYPAIRGLDYIPCIPRNLG